MPPRTRSKRNKAARFKKKDAAPKRKTPAAPKRKSTARAASRVQPNAAQLDVAKPTVDESKEEFDLGKLIAVIDKENATSGNNANLDCTENTKTYTANQKKYVKEFTDYLAEHPLYKTLAEPVSNPTHFGDTNVPRILVTCAQKSNDTLQIANATITEYFKSITLVTPDKTSGCPFPKTSTMNTRIRTFFSALSSLHQWELDSDDFKGFPGCFHANMKTEYARRVAKWPDYYGTKQKNRIMPEDAEKIRLDKFDEMDPEQHQMKVLLGCGLIFGLRGVAEHTQLRVQDIIVGKFGPGEAYPGTTYVGIGELNSDKCQKLNTNTPYLRDTSTLMRIPVQEEDDGNCFASALLRLKNKCAPGQERLYCHVNKTDVSKTGKDFHYPFYTNKPIGANQITKLIKKGAQLLGLNMTDFRGGHALRRFFVTGMVNDPTVPLQESMRASRHQSISAHMAYTETDKISEGMKIASLLRRNNAMGDLQSSHAKKIKHTHSPHSREPLKSVSINTSRQEPDNTQEEFEAFQAELKDSQFAENAPSHCGEPNTPDFDDCKPSAENSHDFNTPDMTLSQQAVSTASAQLNAVLVKGNSEKPPSGPPFQNPYARNNTNPYQSTNRKPDNHRNRPYVSSAPNNPYSRKYGSMPSFRVSSSNDSCQPTRSHKMSKDQAEIRRLRVELQNAVTREREHAQHAVSREREHAQDVHEYKQHIQDYQQRLSDVEANFSFNHTHGKWYNKRHFG